MKIGFIGVGKLGKEVAEVMHEAGHDVMGYDVKVIYDTKISMTTQKYIQKLLDHRYISIKKSNIITNY
jgi:6-phosphogluconate dehydrogenase (decarboxylating)